jgi:2-iminobutanoate/2-iminopropanoate deaminase
MEKKVLMAKGAAAVGPYSHGIEINGIIFLSAQSPVDPATDTIVEGNVEAQTAQCIKNLRTVLEAAGLTLENAVKTTVFLSDINDFDIMNKIYKEYFTAPYPARSTIAVKELPLGSRVEIELIAAK